MSLINSVNTNVGAMIALESLNKTNSDLATVQKQVSTGYRVADATDDGAAYAIAQGVRSTVGALTTANQQLGNVQGLLSTTQSGLNNISQTMASMRNILVEMGNSTGSTFTHYQEQYKSLLKNVKTFIQDATYNDKTLIGNFSTDTLQAAKVNVIRNDTGATYGILSMGMSAVYNAITNLANVVEGSATLSTAIQTGFASQMDTVAGYLNSTGASINYVSNQVSYNKDKIDALNSGLGSLVDADLAKESAQLQALQIRQQLGTQALSLANQAPQTLLSLFK